MSLFQSSLVSRCSHLGTPADCVSDDLAKTGSLLHRDGVSTAVGTRTQMDAVTDIASETTPNTEQRTKNRKQRTQNREQRTKSKEQRTTNTAQKPKNKEQRTKNTE